MSEIIEIRQQAPDYTLKGVVWSTLAIIIAGFLRCKEMI